MIEVLALQIRSADTYLGEVSAIMDDPVDLILAALAAGAGAGVSDTAGSVVRDSYQAFKNLLRRRFASHPAAERAVEQFDSDPSSAEDLLHHCLSELDPSDRQELLHQAEALLRVVGADDGRRPTVIVKKSKGVQVGSHSHQINIY